ncbi:hypothetical protein [Thermomonas sp.]|uniref:hypothetical protein n=1 Tax=Thermomonas sp. TaxID=1971895 RepID=UPI0035B2A3EF
MSDAADLEEMEKAFIALGMRAMHGAFFLTVESQPESPDARLLISNCDEEVLLARKNTAGRFEALMRQGYTLAETFGHMFAEGWLNDITDRPARGFRKDEH